MAARPQYSGESFVIFLMPKCSNGLSVIFLASLTIHSLTGPSSLTQSGFLLPAISLYSVINMSSHSDCLLPACFLPKLQAGAAALCNCLGATLYYYLILSQLGSSLHCFLVICRSLPYLVLVWVDALCFCTLDDVCKSREVGEN